MPDLRSRHCAAIIDDDQLAVVGGQEYPVMYRPHVYSRATGEWDFLMDMDENRARFVEMINTKPFCYESLSGMVMHVE